MRRPRAEGRSGSRSAGLKFASSAGQEDYMRLKIASCIALLLVGAALVRALPAITDNVDVKIEEWMTPSKPAYPHDPAVAPDGSVWYTGQRANVIGRFDPATQQFKEYTLPTANSGPHGLQP